MQADCPIRAALEAAEPLPNDSSSHWAVLVPLLFATKGSLAPLAHDVHTRRGRSCCAARRATTAPTPSPTGPTGPVATSPGTEPGRRGRSGRASPRRGGPRCGPPCSRARRAGQAGRGCSRPRSSPSAVLFLSHPSTTYPPATKRGILHPRDDVAPAVEDVRLRGLHLGLRQERLAARVRGRVDGV